jgi:hypothetical protein
MEKLGATMDRTTKGNSHQSNPHSLKDGLKISNSQVKRLERELKNLKEEVKMRPCSR